jgi:hypothetical protein
MAYDPKCLELAQYFLPSEIPQSRMAVRLAQCIQDAVEVWMTYERARIIAALTPREGQS